MRISDWSSDVCSSDLEAPDRVLHAMAAHHGDAQVLVHRQLGKEIRDLERARQPQAVDVLRARALDVLAVEADAPLVRCQQRSEERRVGKECVSTCRSRWSTYH